MFLQKWLEKCSVLVSANPAVLKPSDPLMEVDLQNLDVGVCRKAYGKDAAVGNYVKFSNKILCAGSLSKRNDVCQVTFSK